MGFSGRYRVLNAAFEQAFGSGLGLFAFSLVFSGEAHCPAEVAADLLEAEACRVAALLERAGATVTVVPTADVEAGLVAVKRRHTEVWPTRVSSNGRRFTEFDGLILTLTPLNARENVAILRARDGSRPNWSIEAAVNHQHPTHDLDRNALRMAREMGADLSEALREQYPEHGFVIDYLEEQVSFYQRDPGAPEHDEPPAGAVTKEVYCPQCGRSRPYTLRTIPDAEFPNADWADCNVCGGEILLRTGRVRQVIGPLTI
jgi:hypothetical protein